jgi:hypothetical protein
MSGPVCIICGRSVTECGILRRVNPKGQTPFEGVCDDCAEEAATEVRL